MPQHFKHRNGANIAGHADKWSNDQRRDNSHDAGQGSKGSRNMGTGQDGKLNTMPTNSKDTKDMKYNDKLKYFNQLGLLSDNKPKPQLKDFPDLLRSTFADEREYLKDISQALKSIPRNEYQEKIQLALNAYYETSQQTDDVYDLYAAIMQVLTPMKESSVKRSPNNNTSIKNLMTPEEFIETNDDIPEKYLISLIKQAEQFDDFHGALFYISMGRDNSEDWDDWKSVLSSMSSTADSLEDIGFDLK